VVRRIRPVSHDDKLSVVDHLDELRNRLIVSLLAFVVAWALTTWQNHLILEIVNNPLPVDDATGKQIEPITLGPTEAFTTTLLNAAYFALILSAPVILYQLYAFILPAFSPTERRVATPLLVMVPFLFIAGVVFCYFVVLPPALSFLLNFNASEFNTQVRAKDYYSFVTMLMLVMGLGFQIPIGILAACKLGVTNAEKLRRNRRYAIVLIVVLAALLPTLDPISLILESLPFYLLYELSILLAARWGRPAYDVSDEPAAEGL
jgi:sec-independent protein translocase protein TatC